MRLARCPSLPRRQCLGSGLRVQGEALLHAVELQGQRSRELRDVRLEVHEDAPVVVLGGLNDPATPFHEGQAVFDKLVFGLYDQEDIDVPASF